jgi:zinc protease
MFSQSMVPSISLGEMNEMVKQWITDENMVIYVTAPEKEKEKIPSSDQLLALYQSVKNANYEAYVDNVSTEPLIGTAPKAGKVSKETQNKVLGVTEWQLSNGIKVILKPTDFKEDEVLLSAYSPGGFSLAKDADVPSAQMVSTIAMMSGVGNHSKVDLDKALAGKIVNVSPYVAEFEEGISGTASPQNLEEMFQLVYLYFTNPRFDESSFNAYMSRIQAVLQNAGNNPNMIFRDSVSYISSNRHVRRKPMNINLIKEVNLNTIKSIYTDRFADASDFTFIFVGNINPSQIKPLVETYLASLPNKKRKETFKDNNIRFPKGKLEYPLTVAMQVPKSSCFVAYQGKADYNFKNRLFMDAIDHALTLRYTETIREKEGGTYGVSSRVSLIKTPVNQSMVNINFDTDPAKAKHLVGIIHSEFKKIIDEGPTEADLVKAREYFLKIRQERLRDNRFWSSTIRDFYSNGIDVLTGYEDMVKSLNSKDIQKAAKEFFKDANTIEIIMSPAN